LAQQPQSVQTATLVERSYKTYPLHVNYVGVSLSTTLEDHISVVFKNGELQGAYLE
jgi:pyrimidine operon attenuation protein/uracil phosphoribosyltransferase